MARKRIPNRLLVWIAARKRHHLTHAQVQMARELGMNPKKMGKIDNHEQESWEMPLPQFIEVLYLKRFDKPFPDAVMSSIEERFRIEQEKKEARRAVKRQAKGET